MTTKIIGLCGYPGAGKDTAAEVLLKRGWTRVAFGDALKEGALGCDPAIAWHYCWWWPWKTTFIRLSEVVEEHGWDYAKRHFPEVRRFLQRYGTEGGRDIHGAECWQYIGKMKIMTAMLKSPGVVVTDVRFPNEAKMIHELGGIIARIHRKGCVPINGHSSEFYDFKADLEFQNDHSVHLLFDFILKSTGVGQ